MISMLSMLFPHNKRGFAYNMLLMLFFRIALVFLIVFVLVFLVNSSLKKAMQTNELRANLAVQELMDMPGVLATVSDAGVVQRGVISLEMFVQTAVVEKTLADRMDSGEFYLLSASIQLVNLTSGELMYEGKKAAPLYYHKEWYERWLVLTGPHLKGIGSYDLFVQRRLVTVIDDHGSEFPAIAIIHIILPRP